MSPALRLPGARLPRLLPPTLLSKFCPAPLLAAELVAKVSDIFQPRNLSVALSPDTAAPGTSCAAAAWGAAFAGPASYAAGGCGVICLPLTVARPTK